MKAWEKKYKAECERRKEYADKLMADSTKTHCYILKGGSFYRPNSQGYTNYQHSAGIFSKQDAIKEYMHCHELSIRATTIEEHNKLIRDEIELLTKLLLTNEQ